MVALEVPVARLSEVATIEVVVRVAVLVGLHRAISIADVDRIDGRDAADEVHKVSLGEPCVFAIVHIGVGDGLGVGVTDIGTELEPLLDLVVGLDTSGKTLVASVLDDTIVLEEVDAGEVRAASLPPFALTVYS